MGVSSSNDLTLVVLGGHAVDVGDLAQTRPLLPAAGLHHAADRHALAEAVLVDHAAGHEGVGQFARVVVLRVAEEAVAVGVHFEHAAARLELADLAPFLDRFGHLLLLAVVRRRRAIAVAAIVGSAAAAGGTEGTTSAAVRTAFLPFSHVHTCRTSPSRSRRSVAHTPGNLSQAIERAPAVERRAPSPRSQFPSCDENRQTLSRSAAGNSSREASSHPGGETIITMGRPGDTRSRAKKCLPARQNSH